MKAMTKQQLAYKAGVSVRTLNNWCKPYEQQLLEMGMTPRMKVLTPKMTMFLAEKLCIDMD